MRSPFKYLLLLSFAPFALLTGCAADAEETKKEPAAVASSVGTSVADTNNAAAAAVSTNAPGTSATLTGTNTTAAVSTNGTNVVINQEITILSQIPPTTPPSVKLSKGVEEIVKLAQSGVDETVILTYIEKADVPYDLDASEILYLNDLGISATVIAAMLNHDDAPEDLKKVLEENKTEVADAPVEPASPTPVPATNAQGVVMVSTNYVPNTTGYGAAQEAATEQPQVVEQQPVVVQQPVIVEQPVVYAAPAVSHSYFYSSLSPYGSWLLVDGYGWCWQPSVARVNYGWRPYLHGGQWLHSDYGWYWQSDYSWGWAPFHYGRWFCAPRRGWVWMPDYTWGPSWVTWRYARDYCGWAPLPPHSYYRPGIGFSYFDRHVGVSFSFGFGYDHYAFVPTRHFAHRRPLDCVVPTDRTVNIYKDSTVINNYVVGNNNTIVNRGISRDAIAAQSHQEIRKVGVRDVPGTSGRMIQPERLTKVGQEMVVYRPTPPSADLAAKASVATPSIRRPATTGRPVVDSRTVDPGASRATLSPRAETQEVRRPSVGEGLVISQSDAARRQIASRSGSEFPTWARPEPIRVASTRPSSVTASAGTSTEVRRPSATVRSAGPGSGLVATSPTGRPQELGTVRPIEPSRAVSSRPSPWNGNTGLQTPGTRVRPSVVTPGPSSPTLRSEAPGSTLSRSAEPARPVMRSSGTPRIGQTPVPGANIGSRGEPARPSVAPRTRQTEPVRTFQQTRPAVSPAPNINRPSSFNNPATLRPAPASPIARSTPSPAIRQEPQVVRRAPQVIRQPPQAVAPRTLHSEPVRPQRIAPAPTYQPRPAMSVPSAPAPVIRSQPAPVVRSQPAPVVSRPDPGVRFSSPAPQMRSAPAAAPRPTVQSQQRTPTGRGRVEIGR